MLFASNFAMNAKPGARHTKIYPFAHIFTNHHKVAFLMMMCLLWVRVCVQQTQLMLFTLFYRCLCL